MKLALIGYGKMGRALEALALEKGHSIAAVIDPFVKGAPASGAPVYASLEDALEGELKNAEGAIEFTRPDTAPGNIKFLVEHKIPVTVGTTGWYAKLPEITLAVKAAGASLLWASNFSLGVNLFYRIAANAAALVDPFAEYDVGGFEVHHNKKADSPSGTAITLVEKVLSKMKRKTKAVYDKLDRPPQADELHFASLRVGAAPGVHSLIFDSSSDTIEITHTLRNREGLAAGAILAAEWLGSRSGVYTIDDALSDILNRSTN
jgi:4-hydroxy-tetrahydrodipicolinate reductase